MPDDDSKNDESPEPAFDAAAAAAEFAAAMAEEPPDAEGSGAPREKQDNYTAILEDEIETLKGLLAEKEEALAAAQKRADAATAESAQVRARLQRTANESIEQKRRKVLASFLDVADALDRAVAELDKSAVADAVAQGVHAVRSEMHSVLARHGAKHRPAVGQMFDPEHHEAIATAPVAADAPAGTITAVLSEGYVLGEVTLRVARVVVAKG